MPTTSPVLRSPRAFPLVLLSSGWLLLVWLAVSHAQAASAITPDGTLGTAVTQNGRVYAITGGTRPGNGPNLFHSFDRFRVGTGDTARFSGPNGIENILSRVTGGQASLINGRLQSTIDGANLYLLNPHGVLFGPNATLDVSGSFHVSTADVLRFADGAAFAADPGAHSTLTVAPPAAFGFMREHPAGIAFQGSTLQVPTGATISVVGGDIQLVGGTLTAPSGQIHMASVASPGDVRVRPFAVVPTLPGASGPRLGGIALSQDARLETSGNGGGTVRIRGGRLVMDHARIAADTQGEADGARLGVDLQIAAEALLTKESRITADTLGPGRGGDLTVQGGRVTLTDGALISTTTFGAGAAGTVVVEAPQVLLLAAVLPLRECDVQLALDILAYHQQRNRAASLSHRKRRTALITQRECTLVVVLGDLQRGQ